MPLTVPQIIRVDDPLSPLPVPRFYVEEGSHSGHCCFDASVMDRERPGFAVCECLDYNDAVAIAAALNLAFEAKQ